MIDEKSKEFMQLVEQHERQWGTERYRKRPDLHEILMASVVVFWQTRPNPDTGELKDTRHKITLHDALEDIERYLLRMLFAQGGSAHQRITAIFRSHKRMQIKSIKIVFAEASE